ncbi:Uncharacterised protein [Mycobacteroides abscessus subsp. abscessus]|nr:Uncharacterised protein [Mycobacteroides abscessus subsp. abscessus]
MEGSWRPAKRVPSSLEKRSRSVDRPTNPASRASVTIARMRASSPAVGRSS